MIQSAAYEGFTDFDIWAMQQALKQAQVAAEQDEVPVGAVIVHEGQIIGKAHNQIEMLKDPTAHCEMIAITQAASYLSSKWLHKCAIYVTLEPCAMCAGALVLARISRLIFGAVDPKTGACGSVFNIAQSNDLNHRIETRSGLLQDECGDILKTFFQKKRINE